MFIFAVSLLLFRKGHLDIVKYLVDGGHCQPNSKDENGETILHHAARYTCMYIKSKSVVLLQINMRNSSIVVYCLRP